MLGSNPSADSVPQPIDKRGCYASPFHLLVEASIGRGIKALNPGVRGQSPCAPAFPSQGRRTLIMRESACGC